MNQDQFDGLRQHLLNIVEDRLIKQGYRAMSVDDIAAEAGISKRTLYVIFESKEDMASQVIDRVFARVEEAMAKVSSISDPLERFCKEELAIVETFPPIDHVSHVKTPVFRNRLDQFAKRRIQHRTNLFREAQEKGLVRPGIRPEIITLMYAAAVRNLIDSDNRIQYSFSSRTAVENTLEVFLEGLRPR